MRVMVFMKATPEDEANWQPNEADFAAMIKYNEELVRAGVMLEGEGLSPTADGKKVRFSGGRAAVIDGPFTESKEFVAGYWMLQVKSMEEAVEWVKRCPSGGQDFEIEIRPIAEADDLGVEFTPELREQEDRLRAEVAKQREQ